MPDALWKRGKGKIEVGRTPGVSILGALVGRKVKCTENNVPGAAGCHEPGTGTLVPIHPGTL